MLYIFLLFGVVVVKFVVDIFCLEIDVLVVSVGFVPFLVMILWFCYCFSEHSCTDCIYLHVSIVYK